MSGRQSTSRNPVQIPQQQGNPFMDSQSSDVVRIAPFHYIHVQDTNKNVTRIVTGPRTFTRQDHEQIVFGPTRFITIPPMSYCTISDPIKRKDDGTPDTDRFGQYLHHHGDQEVRTYDSYPEPFALFPGEKMIGSVRPLEVVGANEALRLRAERDFNLSDGERKQAGDDWLFHGPGVYVPRVEVAILERVKATLIKPNQALRIRARRDCVDHKGIQRRTGEEWLVRENGAYMPSVDEEKVEVRTAMVLTERIALHLRATKEFTDVYNVKRSTGEEWLITDSAAPTHVQDVYEDVVDTVNITVLTNRQYCVVLDPVGSDGSSNQLGTKELRKGPCSFFLKPGESLEDNRIKDVFILSEDEALLLRAKDQFVDQVEGKKAQRNPGDQWMIRGPTEYVPPVEVEIVTRRRTIPLDANEGIYVRDTQTGNVRAVLGPCSYMLASNEEPWEKQLPSSVEDLLDFHYFAHEEEKKSQQTRDKTRVVTYRVPHNAAVQVYDYKVKASRVVFGPDLVMLNPDEQFTVISLSGDKPKKPNLIRSLALILGPDFMTDIVNVETSDHARLALQLSYNWHFEVADKKDPEAAARLFSVRDFVGDACKAIASRVRGAVASETFDNFHRHSAKIIRTAVFGCSPEGRVNNRFVFGANNLIITNIDIQSAEPVDPKTRDSLQKSVQLAIEITTKRQQSNATHNAMQEEQHARGKLERQKLSDDAEAEESRKRLKQLIADCAAVESTGQAKAEAKANAESKRIEGEAAVRLARFKADASDIEWKSQLEHEAKLVEEELEFQRAINDLDINKSKQLNQIEADKFKQMISAIGASTIRAIATAGPELQAKLLRGLGLNGFLVTDGNSPINLFNTANGMLGNSGAQPADGAANVHFANSQ